MGLSLESLIALVLALRSTVFTKLSPATVGCDVLRYVSSMRAGSVTVADSFAVISATGSKITV